MSAPSTSSQGTDDLTSGETVAVPVGLLARLADEYLRGHCPIKGGWGESRTIESLIGLVPPAQAVRALLPASTWEATVWVAGGNYVHGTIDGACRTRIIDAIVDVLSQREVPAEGGAQ